MTLAVIIAVLAISAPAKPARSADCESMRLDERGRSMEHVPALNQSFGICFADSASQLIDAWRHTHPTPGDTPPGLYRHLTSPLDVAIGEGGNNVDNPLAATPSNGWTCDAARYAIRRGSCDRRALEGHFDEVTQGRDEALLRGFYLDYQNWRNQHRDLLSSATEVARIEATKDRVLACLRHMGIPARVLPSRELLGVLLSQTDPLQFLGGVMGNGCLGAHRRRVSASGCADVWNGSASSFRELVLSRLSPAGPSEAARRAVQPVAITYCAEVLLSGRHYRGVASRPGAFEGAVTRDDCKEHVSLIIGKRVRGGRCQLLLRNSWGRGCAQTQFAHWRYSSDWQCESGKGNVWVDADALMENAYGVHYLE